MREQAARHVRILGPFAAGYFLSYLYRVVNAVIAPDLVADLGLGPSDLGLLTSAYFLTFAAFQLPLGVLLDRFEPRKVEALLLCAAAAGSLLFSVARTPQALVVGRGLIGLGVSACLMAAFTSFARGFPAERLPMVNGFQMAAGGLGALAATAPVQAALRFTDWRGIFGALAVATVAVAVLIRVVVPRDPGSGAGQTLGEQVAGVRSVFGSRVFWRLAPLAVASQASFLALQGLWAGPWLHDVAGLPREAAAAVLFWTAAAMIAGFLALGGAAAFAARRGVGPGTLAAAGMGVFGLLQVALACGGLGLPRVLWVLFGFFGTSGILCYASLVRAFPPGLAGRVNTALNLLVFVAAFGVQWGLGALLGLWPRTADGGYDPAGYGLGVGALAAAQALGLLWYARGAPVRAAVD